ncbi:MAG: FeoB-associated Cys-rich membrane protein [Clostridia bacterium]|nr:FeoB-associated Cys-rich membrane protein [Clostridia bacterium]
MNPWLSIALIVIIAAVFVAIIAKGIINKKNGKTSCSCGGCSGCGMKGTCHK